MSFLSYCQHGSCHTCGDACCLKDTDCPSSYCANDDTKVRGTVVVVVYVYVYVCVTIMRACTASYSL